MTDVIERLAGHLLQQDDELWLVEIGEKMDAWLERGGDPRTFLACFSSRDLEARNEAYRAGFECVTSAAELHRAACQFETTAWPHCKDAVTCPTGHLGTVNEYIWRALKADPRVPRPRTLRLIVNGSGNGLLGIATELCDEE